MLGGVNQTFAERYCRAAAWPSKEFSARVFWRCLHRHGVLFAPFVGFVGRDYFAPDRDLIGEAGRCETLVEIDEAIRAFVRDDRNRTWWRSRGRVRISTKKLRRLARSCFNANLRAAAAAPAR